MGGDFSLPSGIFRRALLAVSQTVQSQLGQEEAVSGSGMFVT